jgi:hypothetical protein
MLTIHRLERFEQMRRTSCVTVMIVNDACARFSDLATQWVAPIYFDVGIVRENF